MTDFSFMLLFLSSGCCWSFFSLFFCFMLLLLYPGVAVIFCDVIISFTCCSDGCITNLLSSWTVCCFHQNNIFRTITGIRFAGCTKTIFHIFLVIIFVRVSLWEMKVGCTWFLGKKEFIRLFFSVSSFLKKITSFWVIHFDL